MQNRPSLCPACGAFVRHDWTDICGRCGTPLIETSPEATTPAAPTEEATFEPAPSWVLPGATTGPPQATAPTLPAVSHPGHSRLPLILAAIGVVIALVVGTTIVMAGELEGKPSAIATTVPESTTSTTVKPPTDLGQQFTAGLASSKRFAIDDLPRSGGDLKAAQLARSQWSHYTDSQCRCTADFPYAPVQESGTIDGDLPVHQVYSVGSESPIGLVVFSLDIGPNVSLGDNDMKGLAAAYLEGLGASITSSNTQTVKGNRGLLVRGLGNTSVVASVFQNNTMVYLVVAFTTNTADDPLPVYSKLIDSFSTSAVA